MSILLKHLRLASTDDTYQGELVNILVENGVIVSLNGKKAEKEFNLKGCFVSEGWMDLNANFHDPGDEIHEDLESGCQTAAAGGFTDVQVSPDTNPVLESKSAISYIQKHSQHGVDLHAAAAVSTGLLGEGLTEILDLYDAGALSFSNGDTPIWNSELLLRALQYTKSISSPIFQNARDRSLSKEAQMHEGVFSTELGMRGEPSLSEHLVIQRDIEILKYSGGKLHFSCVSTAKGVDMIREAKERGLSVTADVGIHHLLFTDKSVANFDTNFKVLPPYRAEEDRIALITGVRTGVIDAICSNHQPFTAEFKALEFDLAAFGNISLQTFYSCLLALTPEIPLPILLEKITKGPRRILGLGTSTIKEGAEARLTIFNPSIDWVLDQQANYSKSVNSPFWGQNMKGKVVGIVNKSFNSIDR